MGKEKPEVGNEESTSNDCIVKEFHAPNLHMREEMEEHIKQTALSDLYMQAGIELIKRRLEIGEPLLLESIEVTDYIDPEMDSISNHIFKIEIGLRVIKEITKQN